MLQINSLISLSETQIKGICIAVNNYLKEVKEEERLIGDRIINKIGLEMEYHGKNEEGEIEIFVIRDNC